MLAVKGRVAHAPSPRPVPRRRSATAEGAGFDDRPEACESAMMSVDLESLDAAAQDLATPSAPEKKRGGGPKTAAGRDASKRNSLKHGLLAEKVFPEGLT